MAIYKLGEAAVNLPGFHEQIQQHVLPKYFNCDESKMPKENVRKFLISSVLIMTCISSGTTLMLQNGAISLELQFSFLNNY